MLSFDQMVAALETALKNHSLNQTLRNEERDSNLAAKIRYDKDGRPRWASRITIPLDTAMSFSDKESREIFGEPFDSLYVEDATDPNVSIKLSWTGNLSYQVVNFQTLKLNDSLSFGKTVSGAGVAWDAQAGKTITIVAYLGADFRPGATRQELSGGVTVTSGTSFSQSNEAAIGDTTPVALFAVDSTRSAAFIQNQGTSDVYLGPVGVTNNGTPATRGILLEPGDTYYWQNTAALYAVAEASGTGNLHITRYFT